MIGRLVTRAVDAQARWSKPFGDFNHRWLSALFRPIRPIKDFLNGVWLGHPAHSAITDLPIGALTVAIVLELVGQHGASNIALVVAVVSIGASIVTGLADYTDVDGTARMRATVHATVMLTGQALFVVSLLIRGGNPSDRALPTLLVLIGFGVISLGAAIGGDLVFLIGTHVNRHAWRGSGQKWIALDLGGLPDIPQGGPTRLKAGINELAVIRDGDRILALHAQCAHAGGPLAEGAIVGGDRIECPWHGSRFLLANGHVVRGPAMYDQPAYEVRRAESGDGWEVRRQSA